MGEKVIEFTIRSGYSLLIMQQEVPVKKLALLSLLLILSALFLSCRTDAPAPTVLFSEDFSSYADLAEPLDWVFYNGTNSTSLVTGTEKALRLQSAEAAAAVYDGSETDSWTDYTLTFKMKASSSNGYFIILLRTNPQAENANAYYQLNIAYTGAAPENYGWVVAKNTSTIAGTYVLDDQPDASLAFAADTYYEVRIELNGGNIKAYFNGSATPFANVTDDGTTYEALITNGGFGFFTASGTWYVDDIVVTEL